MILIERPIGTDRESDAVERQLVSLSNGRQVAVRRAARAHVVFRVDFEEADSRQRFDNRAVMLGLKTDAPARWNAIFSRRRWKQHGNLQSKGEEGGCAARPTTRYQAFGVRLPGPFGVCIVVQVPLASSLNALPW